MSIRDHFNHVDEQKFPADVSGSDRKAWLEKVRETAVKTGIQMNTQETDEGYEIGFPTEKDYDAFTIAVRGNCEGGKSGCTTSFADFTVDPMWMKAASMVLTQLEIKHTSHTFYEAGEGQKAEFEFERHSDMMVYRKLSSGSLINEMAERLRACEQVKDDAYQLRSTVEQRQNGHEPLL